MTEIDDLRLEVANLLAELAFVAEADATVSFNAKIAHGSNESRRPAGDGEGLLDRRVAALRQWCAASRTELDRARRRAPSAVTAEQRQFWVMQDEGLDAREVADRHGLSVPEVRQIRQRHGREADRGRERKSGQGRKPVLSEPPVLIPEQSEESL